MVTPWKCVTNAIFSLVLILCIPLVVWAGDVKLEKAELVAQNWIKSSFNDRSQAIDPNTRIVGKEIITFKQRTVGYNFLLFPQGHIIVPSRDELPVVKLYSFTNTLSMEKDSETSQWIKEELYLLNEGIDAHQAEMAVVDHERTPNGRLWSLFDKDPAYFGQDYENAFGATESLSLGPILTTTWDQADPYNLHTPLWYNGTKTVTGCVATAAAQIMKFWNYPATGQGSTSYSWNNGSTNQTLSANFASSTYGWSSMTSGYGSGSTTAQREAVAKLMSDVGIAFHMTYGTSAAGGSSAATLDGATVFPTYFKYKSTAHTVSRSSYASDSAWMQVFKSELQAGRPSQIRLRDPSAGGHSVVVDGYRDSPSEQIHLNMGWSGSYNGWYVSNNIVTGGYSWSDVGYQAAVVGIEPAVIPLVCNPPASLAVPATSSTGNYTVSWGASTTTGVTYILEESTTSTFSSVTAAYTGTALSAAIHKTANGTFYYRVKATKSGYTDSGYVVSSTACVVTIPTISLPVAIDDPAWVIATGGNANWYGQSAVNHDGTDAARSGAITHSQSTWMQTTVAGPGTIGFWWKVSSESGYDKLRFYIDTTEATAAISGEQGWTQVSGISVPAGTHTIKWQYGKDATTSTGSDAGWVDQVVYSSTSTGQLLTVNLLGLGGGTVTPNSGTLSWSGKTGTASYVTGTSVILTASPAPGSSFGGWGGACSGTALTCTVPMTTARSVTATFNGRRIMVLDNSLLEMSHALDIIGNSYTRLDAAGFTAATLGNYDIIMTSWSLPSATVTALVSRKAEIANWTRSGGRLFTSSSNGNTDWSWVPLSVTPASGSGEDVTVVATAHPLMTTPHALTTAAMSNWYTSYHNVWSSYDPAYELICKNTANKAIVLAASYGGGMIVVSGSDPEYHTIHGPTGGRYYLENLLSWSGYSSAGRIGGQVTDAVTGTSLTGVTVTATGPSSASAVSLSGTYSINYLTPGSYTVTARKAGYADAVRTGVVVTTGITTTANLALAPLKILTINSTNPASGVAITVTPDYTGLGNGVTPFTRGYASGTNVTLTAPATSSLGSFSGWTGCASVSGYSCTVAMTAAKTVTANYGAVNVAPVNVSVTPSSGTGTSQTFGFAYSDANGFADINHSIQVINSSLEMNNGCVTAYDNLHNLVYLLNDAGIFWLGPVTPGTSGVLSNRQCGISMTGATITRSGNNLTVGIPTSFTAAFAGGKNVYMIAQDRAGLNSGWQQKGRWMVGNGVNVAPLAVSVTPSSGTGPSRSFSFAYSDGNGYTDAFLTMQIINSTLQKSNGCATIYIRPSNQLFLLDDAGTSWLGPAVIGTSGTLNNSQCSINLGGAFTTQSNLSLNLNIPITFSSTFRGLKNVYMLGMDNGGLGSGWQQRGSWTPY